MSKTDELREIIRSSNNIVFFGGAGVSTESGIPDFRSKNGIFKSLEEYGDIPENLISHTYFSTHTEKFYRYYRKNLIFKDAKPNPCHLALEKLEKCGKLKAVVTQNIDGLHQKAGSKNVLELHGSIYRNYCCECGRKYSLDYILKSSAVPLCDCGGIVRPDVVLYEEALNGDILNLSIDYISNADTLIVGGTSLAVYPANSLINYFNGDNLVLINKSETPYDSLANLLIHDAIGEVMDKIDI